MLKTSKNDLGKIYRNIQMFFDFELMYEKYRYTIIEEKNKIIIKYNIKTDILNSDGGIIPKLITVELEEFLKTIWKTKRYKELGKGPFNTLEEFILFIKK